MTQRSLRALIAAALLLPATSALAEESGGAPPEDDYAPAGQFCEDDSACDEGETCIYGYCEGVSACESADDCWTGWCADGVCAEAPACTEDAECGEGNICEWGYCGPKGNSCLSDADCGAYTRCDFDGGTTTVVVEVDTSEPSSGSGSAEAPAYDESGDPPEGEPYYEETEWPERGQCVIDAEVVPVDDDCVALCEAAMACGYTEGPPSAEPGVPMPAEPTEPAEERSEGAEGGASESDGGSDEAEAAPYPYDEDDYNDEDPYYEEEEDDFDAEAFALEVCTTMCNYGVAIEAPGSESVADALACVEANTCDAVEANCEPEIEAINDMFEAIDDVAELDMERDDTTSGGSTTTGATDPQTDENSEIATPGAYDAPASDGCSGGGAGAPWALVFATLVLLAVRLRRRGGVRAE